MTFAPLPGRTAWMLWLTPEHPNQNHPEPWSQGSLWPGAIESVTRDPGRSLTVSIRTLRVLGLKAPWRDFTDGQAAGYLSSDLDAGLVEGDDWPPHPGWPLGPEPLPVTVLVGARIDPDVVLMAAARQPTELDADVVQAIGAVIARFRAEEWVETDADSWASAFAAIAEMMPDLSPLPIPTRSTR